MAEMYTIKIHAIPLSDDDGGRANTATAAQFATVVDAMNDIYKPVDIRFAFDAKADWRPRNDTTLNNLDLKGLAWADEANTVAGQHVGRMVIFLRWGRDSAKRANNWFAYPPHTGQSVPPEAKLPAKDVNFIVITNDGKKLSGGAAVLAHEVGHYLGLFHTHPGWGETETQKIEQLVADHGLAGLDGDLLSDTAPDPGNVYYAEKVDPSICGGPASFTIGGKTVTPPRSNVMSYFRCRPVTITAQQIKVVRDTLKHESRNHLIQTSAGVRYAGVFLPGKDAQKLWVGDDWEGFKEKRVELAEEGLRLHDLESYVVGGRRRYTGVFRQGSGGHALWVSNSWDGFTKKRAECAKEGLRLHDLESWVDGSVRSYAGVYLPGTGDHELSLTDSWKVFNDKRREFSKAGLRLHDFETWIDGDKRMYAGVFLPGSEKHALWVTDDWDGFNAVRKESAKDGLLLHDFETWLEGPIRKYAGVFLERTGTGVLWYNDDWYGFDKKWRELSAQGYRLVDIDVFGSLVS